MKITGKEKQMSRVFFNNEPIRRAVGTNQGDVYRFSIKHKIARQTIIKAMNGDENIIFSKLMEIVEAAKLPYEEVFDGKFYREKIPVTVSLELVTV